MATYRNIFTAPRWAGAQDLIRDLAWEYALKLEIDVSKGRLSETVRFSVEGSDKSITNFSKVMNASVEEYQRRVNHQG